MSAPSAPPPASSFQRSAVIQPGSGFFATFRALWPYLWPAERADLRLHRHEFGIDAFDLDAAVADRGGVRMVGNRQLQADFLAQGRSPQG